MNTMNTGFMNEEDWTSGTGANAGGVATFDENFEFDSSESTEESLRSDGQVELEGWYHFEITKVELNLGLLTEDGKENTPNINFTCKVLQSVPGQSPAGAALWHRMYVASKGGEPPKQGSIDSMFRFGLGIGHLVWGKNASGANCPVLKKTGATKIPVKSWEDCVGLQFIAAVKKEKQEANSQYKPKFAIPMGKAYRPDHPEVAHVPKNLEALEMIGIKIVPQQPAPGTAKKAAAAYKAAEATGQTTSAPTASSPAGKVGAPAQATAQPTQADDNFSIEDY